MTSTRSVVVYALVLGACAVVGLALLDGLAETIVVVASIAGFPFGLAFAARLRRAHDEGATGGRAIALALGLGLRALLPPSPRDVRLGRERARERTGRGERVPPDPNGDP